MTSSTVTKNGTKNQTKIIAEPGTQVITIIREFDAPRAGVPGLYRSGPLRALGRPARV